MRQYFSGIMFAALSVSTYASEFSRADVCKAAISIEMGKDTVSMKTKKAGDTPVISYVRSNDLQEFTYRCKFIDSDVIWSGYLNDEREWGRWRDDPANDAQTTFEIKGSEILIRNSLMGESVFTSDSF